MEKEKDSVKVIFDTVNGNLIIEGKTFMMDLYEAEEFLDPFFKELEIYIKTCNYLMVTIELEYINTGSLSVLYKLFELIRSINPIINWIYKKDDMQIQELGEDLKDCFETAKFILVEK